MSVTKKEAQNILKAHKTALKIAKLKSRITPPKPKHSFEEAYKGLCRTIEDFLEMANDPETSPKLLNDTLKTFVSKIVFSRSDNKIVIFYYV